MPKQHEGDLKSDICDEVDSSLVAGEEVIDGVGEVTHVESSKPRCCLLHILGPGVDQVGSQVCQV